MMKIFFVGQNRGSWIAVSRPESGMNACRKWDGFRRVGEMASGRNGEWANRRAGETAKGRKGVSAWCHIAGWSFGLNAIASDECVCA